MTEPTTPNEHLERQALLSQESQKSAHSPPLSKSLKTPSPGFVSKIPIPARLVKDRSPSTSPTAVIGSKASFTEQNEHWRQYRPPSNITAPTSPSDDSLALKKDVSEANNAFEGDSNNVTTPKTEETTRPTDVQEQPRDHVRETSEDNVSLAPVNESLQHNSESTQNDGSNQDAKGNLKVRFDDNSPEKIASYWDSIQTNIPSKTPNTTPFYKSPLANIVNFDESATENDDSAFMGEISYVSDSDDIRTYRPSFLDETSFMSEMDATNASTATLDKEAAVQRFFAGVSESEFTNYEDSRYADFPESFSKMGVQNSPLNAKSSEKSQHCITENAESSHRDKDIGFEKYDADSTTDIADSATSNLNTMVEDTPHQPEVSENDDRNDARLYSEVVKDNDESTASTNEHSEAFDTEQTVPKGLNPSEDAEQTVPEQENDTDSLRRPNISYADVVSNSPHHTSVQDEQKSTSNMESETSNMEDSSDGSWPSKLPLPSTPFGQEASTQIENHSHGDFGYHSEITWNYNEELITDDNDPKHLEINFAEQEPDISHDYEDKQETTREAANKSDSPNTHVTLNEHQEDVGGSLEERTRSVDDVHQDEADIPPTYFTDNAEDDSQKVVGNFASHVTDNTEQDSQKTDDDYTQDEQLDSKQTESVEVAANDTVGVNNNNHSKTQRFSSIETPHKILKQLSSRQVSSAPPPTKLDKFKISESELPQSAKTVRELTPMRLLQSLSRMTTPSDTIKNLNERFKESDISMTEFDDSFVPPESVTKLVLELSHESNSADDRIISVDENDKQGELQQSQSQSQSHSDPGESSLLEQYDSHAERSEVEEYNSDQSFEESKLEEPSLNNEDYLYEDMVHVINNLKEIMGELRDGQDVHKNLGDALEANLNELNDKTQKRDSLLLEMEAMKDIVDQTNNEMSELKSQLEKRVRSEEEVDAKLADLTEVIDTLRERIKNKAEQATLRADNRLLGSFPSLMFNAFILMGILLILELLFVRVLLRSNDQYDNAFGTMSHGTYYSIDQNGHDQSWSVQLARNVWEILVNMFHGSANGMSAPS